MAIVLHFWKALPVIFNNYNAMPIPVMKGYIVKQALSNRGKKRKKRRENETEMVAPTEDGVNSYHMSEVHDENEGMDVIQPQWMFIPTFYPVNFLPI